jgi:hypothetical protein
MAREGLGGGVVGAVEAEVFDDLAVGLDAFADQIGPGDLVVAVAEAGAEALGLEVAGVEEEADERLHVVRVAADVGHDDDAGFLFVGDGGGGCGEGKEGKEGKDVENPAHGKETWGDPGEFRPVSNEGDGRMSCYGLAGNQRRS